MTPIIVVRKSEDALVCEWWRFVYLESEHRLKLHSYVREKRPTTRHKFREEVQYLSYARNSISVLDVPRPADVYVEARDSFVKTLRVGT